MANTIDCSRMSDISCMDPSEAQAELVVSTVPAKAEPSALPAGAASLHDLEGRRVGGASYECVNDCVSSQGVTALLSGATVSLGCLMVPPACPVFIGTGVGATLGACEVACEDLESQP